MRLTMAALLLLAAPALAAVPAEGQDVDPPGRDPRTVALDAEYRRLVIATHADSGDARRVWAAAMLAALEPLHERLHEGDVGPAAWDAAFTDPRTDTAAALFERALELGRNDAPLVWAIATLDNQRTPALQRVAARASERLPEVDADNAAVWLERLHRQRHVLDLDETDALLARAARATHHSLYYAEQGRMLAAALAEVPMAAELRQRLARDAGTGDPETVHLVRALGIVLAIALPPFQPLLQHCAGDALLAEPRREQCLQLGRRMAATADTVIGESIGLQLWGRAAIDPADRDAQAQARRTARWLQEAYAELLADDLADSGAHWAQASDLWLTPGVSELELQRRVLQRAGVPLEPPEDFRPDAL